MKEIEKSEIMKEIDKIIDEKTLNYEDAIWFYEQIVNDVREMYGTDDPEELKKILDKTEDLWLEQHIWDVIMYRMLKKSRKS